MENCSYLTVVVIMKSVMLRIRVEPEFKEMLVKAVRHGKAKSMSDLIRKAVIKLLESEVN